LDRFPHGGLPLRTSFRSRQAADRRGETGTSGRSGRGRSVRRRASDGCWHCSRWRRSS